MQLHHLKTRARVIQAIRKYFIRHHYLEVDTPVLCPEIIPEAHIDPIQCESGFLQASPELCMKRMLAAGCDRIFQICHTFRKSERGNRHLPEHTLLEWYGAGQTYLDLMDTCQDLIVFISRHLGQGERLHYQKHQVDLRLPWQRLSVEKAFQRYSDTTLSAALASEQVDEIISFQIEPCLGLSRPVFLMDYPKTMAALARLTPSSHNFAERTELYIAGMELANGFTELTAPEEQKKRFIKENQIRRQRGEPALPMPDKFLADLSEMPEAAGMALGVDRLVMLFCNTDCIDDVVAFTPEDL